MLHTASLLIPEFMLFRLGLVGKDSSDDPLDRCEPS
jgi:hypothetical protein